MAPRSPLVAVKLAMPKRDRLWSMRRLEERPRADSQSGNERKPFPRLEVIFTASLGTARRFK